MKKLTSWHWVGILSILSFAACTNEGLESSAFKAEHFPLEVGNYWTYQKIDYLNHKIDTTTATLIGFESPGPGTGLVGTIEWISNLSFSSDTSYIFLNKDSLIFYRKRTGANDLWIDSKFILPFDYGDTWESDTRGIPATVSARNFASETFHLPYGSAFYLKRAGSTSGNYNLSETLLFKKDIGLIYSERHEFNSLPVADYVIRLIDYHLE